MGQLKVFLPPLQQLETFVELVHAIEQTAAALGTPVQLEGYPPPRDPRLREFKVTPDPGVVEVNVPPTTSWREAVLQSEQLYDAARHEHLVAEKFEVDGAHIGSGGGNHVVLGATHPGDSPFLRRPDVLASLLRCWHNHPSLSYLFSGRFIGPTSQAPRVDEARDDSARELELALAQVPRPGTSLAPWQIDRILRNVLIDVTGNTHRAEFCIDKLYSPDGPTGRLGLVELRAFEMPPHERMSAVQQLLVRSLIARFWREPDERPLIHWGTGLQDQFMLPHFVEHDFGEVLAELGQAGFDFEDRWFEPHFEFRFPYLGELDLDTMRMELRGALEPWHVLGEEATASGQARYVDSSVERLQLKVEGFAPERYRVVCNGFVVPVRPTGTNGEYVAGVRYRAWQPPHCLHPQIPVHSPLHIDFYDTWSQRSIAGCTYHVVHPGGRASDVRPVNAAAAESRRLARFARLGHRQGVYEPIELAPPPALSAYARSASGVGRAVAMTYCVALQVDEGLVFAADTRTNAGVDYVTTYRKVHCFRPAEDRVFVLLTSGSLATTRELIDQLGRDLDDEPNSPNGYSLRSARNVLEKQNLKISYGGRQIDPYSVDWSRTDIRDYHVFQPPGSRNALGVVKFLFPNKHAVYMHDTPSKHLFKHKVRAYSHGCSAGAQSAQAGRSGTRPGQGLGPNQNQLTGQKRPEEQPDFAKKAGPGTRDVFYSPCRPQGQDETRARHLRARKTHPDGSRRQGAPDRQAQAEPRCRTKEGRLEFRPEEQLFVPGTRPIVAECSVWELNILRWLPAA